MMITSNSSFGRSIPIYSYQRPYFLVKDVVTVGARTPSEADLGMKKGEGLEKCSNFKTTYKEELKQT